MAMPERKDDFEVIGDILDVCTKNNGMMKTHIVQTTTRSFQRVSQYLESMMERGLIKREGRMYIITEEGDNLRKDIENLRKQLRLT